MYEIPAPQAKHWGIPFLIALLATLLYLFGHVSGQNWKILLVTVAVGCGVWALINFGHHAGRVIADIFNERKQINYKFTENFRLEQLAKMNKDQLTALRAGHHMTDYIPADSGPVEMLRGEEIYLYFAWYVLVHSTNRNVYPIGMFSNETYQFDLLNDHAVSDRQQAHNFHIWLVRYGYAEWSKGNESCRWVGKFNADEVLRRLGLSRDSYEE